MSRRRMAGTVIERWPAHAFTARRTTAHIGTHGGNPALQFLVELSELVHAMKLVGGHTKPAEHAPEQKREPQRQPPANGVSEHGEFRIRCSNPVRAGSR